MTSARCLKLPGSVRWRWLRSPHRDQGDDPRRPPQKPGLDSGVVASLSRRCPAGVLWASTSPGAAGLVSTAVFASVSPSLFLVSVWISFWCSEACSFDGEVVSLFLSVFWIAFSFPFQSFNKYSIFFNDFIFVSLNITYTCDLSWSLVNCSLGVIF